MIGTWGEESRLDRDILLYVDLYLAGRLKLDSLLTYEYQHEDVSQAFDDLERGRVGRAVIDIGQETTC